jgi:hypothetical protein
MGQTKPLGYPAERLAGPPSTQIRGNLAPGRCTPQSNIVLFLKIVVGRGFCNISSIETAFMRRAVRYRFWFASPLASTIARFKNDSLLSTQPRSASESRFSCVFYYDREKRISRSGNNSTAARIGRCFRSRPVNKLQETKNAETARRRTMPWALSR